MTKIDKSGKTDLEKLSTVSKFMCFPKLDVPNQENESNVYVSHPGSAVTTCVCSPGFVSHIHDCDPLAMKSQFSLL